MVAFFNWIFWFSQNKASDANIGIIPNIGSIAILVHFEKNSTAHATRGRSIQRKKVTNHPVNIAQKHLKPFPVTENT